MDKEYSEYAERMIRQPQKMEGLMMADDSGERDARTLSLLGL
jgi:hypothetical protein